MEQDLTQRRSELELRLAALRVRHGELLQEGCHADHGELANLEAEIAGILDAEHVRRARAMAAEAERLEEEAS